MKRAKRTTWIKEKADNSGKLRAALQMEAGGSGSGDSTESFNNCSSYST